MVLSELKPVRDPIPLPNGTVEYAFEGPLKSDESIRMQFIYRIAEDNPVVRFRYALKATNAHKLTKTEQRDDLQYLSFSMSGFQTVKETRLSVFNEMFHSCGLSEVDATKANFAHSTALAGPILFGCGDRSSFLCAFEHDSMYQNRFLEYRLKPDRSATLDAVKGNYFDGQPTDGYSTIWFEAAGVAGNEDELARQYRDFALRRFSESDASRSPFICYNTWGRQERRKWAGGAYLDTMNLDYVLREIDRAHEMGVEVYVLDAGWFEKTGDWTPHPKNFPDGLSKVREKLDAYGMRLGVWMNPEKAAVSSVALKENENCLQTRGGKSGAPAPEWETEDSVDMCLASPYWESCANALIRLRENYGVLLFYFDGISQSGCDDPRHFHGLETNTQRERAECYGFAITGYLQKIMGKVSAAHPDVVFDFDVTESGRIGVGLQFLASGRYFILNNGPYFHNFDLCPKGESILPNGCRNIFINPGPARTWFMRAPLDYDRWLPSNLFVANYQPDDPRNSQILNLASLVLGQNAIWGNILSTSPEGVALFHEILGKYKQVRNDVAAASPERIGRPGDSPEIYEKINPETGKGVVVVFSNAGGTFEYVTRGVAANDVWASEGATVKKCGDGRAEIVAEFKEPSAKIIFFGAE
jgi:alpha-galactosidase